MVKGIALIEIVILLLRSARKESASFDNFRDQVRPISLVYRLFMSLGAVSRF